jgi:hypothetical protein
VDGLNSAKDLWDTLFINVGEFRKTRHPQNVEVNEIRDASFQGQGTHEDLESGIHEVSKSRVRGELDS